ncbi:MAG: efflux RND transporter periplasmic adaptor subunit [Desulfobacterales bacterium]
MRHLLLVLLFLTLCWNLIFFTRANTFAQGPPPAKVKVGRIFQQELAPTNPMVGVLDFDQKSGLSSEINGLIQHQEIQEGARVRKGDLLVRLNTDFLEKDIDILKTQQDQIAVKIDNARKNVQRFKELFQKSAGSEKAYDDLADELSELLLEQEIIQKRIERQKITLVKSRIRAPFNGLILEKHKNEGEWLAAGSAVCTIASIDDIVVRVFIPEGTIRFVQPGQAVSVTIGALDKTLQGEVETLVPVADMTSKTVQVKIVIPYQENIVQNMSATVHIPAAHAMTLMMVPRDALVRNQGKAFIYTVKENTAKILPVTIAAYAGVLVGLSDPYLTEGMPVVIDGNERLRPNQPVEILAPDPNETPSAKTP